MSHRRSGAPGALPFLFAPLVFSLFLMSMPTLGLAQGEGEQGSAPNAQNDPRELFLEGQRSYAAGQYEQAIEFWTRAYELSGLVALQYNIAQAHGRLGQVVEEREALARFILNEDSPEDLKSAARERLAALDERIARTALIIDGDQDGAAVYVNEEHVGELPLERPVHVEPGTYRIVGKLDGFIEASASARVTPGEQLRLFLEFEALEIPTSTRRISPIAWGLWGGGGAALVAGAIVGGLALGKSSGAVRGSSEADTTSRLALAADITISAGAAAILGGVITQIIYKKRTREKEPSLAFEPRLGGAALTLQGDF